MIVLLHFTSFACAFIHTGGGLGLGRTAVNGRTVKFEV